MVNLCPASRETGGRYRAFSAPTVPQLPSAPNNQNAKVASPGLLTSYYSLSLYWSFNFVIISLCVSSGVNADSTRQGTSGCQSFSLLYPQLPKQCRYPPQWFMYPFVPFSYSSHQSELFPCYFFCSIAFFTFFSAKIKMVKG